MQAQAGCPPAEGHLGRHRSVFVFLLWNSKFDLKFLLCQCQSVTVLFWLKRVYVCGSKGSVVCWLLSKRQIKHQCMRSWVLTELMVLPISLGSFEFILFSLQRNLVDWVNLAEFFHICSEAALNLSWGKVSAGKSWSPAYFDRQNVLFGPS